MTAILEGPGELWLMLPIHLVSEANMREHHMAKHRRNVAQQDAVAKLARLKIRRAKITLPCAVTIFRIAPKDLDDDNRTGAGKHVRDALAKLLGVNDGDKRVTWTVEHRRGKVREYACAVRLTWTPA
jgi:hypothetical protein